ncbi:hypothetical protein A4A49_29700 [Nicotiana attenuata]|uniref:Uncharacterized protein n=1 Tax=Nicotiana attenuata TaxID=49451 RepID=A0A314L9Y4_NICAT|nr:hypothetical protein A4A49_29700 [Nicotiana attenuata]
MRRQREMGFSVGWSPLCYVFSIRETNLWEKEKQEKENDKPQQHPFSIYLCQKTATLVLSLLLLLPLLSMITAALELYTWCHFYIDLHRSPENGL